MEMTRRRLYSMITFFTAIGSYQMNNENGRQMPYILHMGRLEPVSIPEFFLWSHLLWEVETYEEIRKYYIWQGQKLGVELPDMDQALHMLVKRKLVAKGIGYTGEDALYDMLSDAFVSPVRTLGGKKVRPVLRMLFQGKITGKEAIRILKPDKLTPDERRVLRLVRQTPLSVSELIRCFDNGVRDVSTPDKVISAIYTDDSDTQDRISASSRQSENRTRTLQAAANLYLGRKVMLDLA